MCKRKKKKIYFLASLLLWIITYHTPQAMRMWWWHHKWAQQQRAKAKFVILWWFFPPFSALEMSFRFTDFHPSSFRCAHSLCQVSNTQLSRVVSSVCLKLRFCLCFSSLHPFSTSSRFLLLEKRVFEVGRQQQHKQIELEIFGWWRSIKSQHHQKGAEELKKSRWFNFEEKKFVMFMFGGNSEQI